MKIFLLNKMLQFVVAPFGIFCLTVGKCRKAKLVLNKTKTLFNRMKGLNNKISYNIIIAIVKINLFIIIMKKAKFCFAKNLNMNDATTRVKI